MTTTTDESKPITRAELTDPEALEVLKYIADGWEIHYAPASGGVIGYKPAESRWTPIPLVAFLKLRQGHKITIASTMRQGHRMFHGHVDIYRAAQK